MGSLAIARLGSAPSIELARRSCAWTAPADADARLVLALPSDEAIVLGAFQRSTEVEPAPSLLRRGSGGPAARVAPGTIWLALALARPSALVPCSADKLLNRYVRPLLRALTRVASVPASYFGRDWISAAHRPVATVAFAHDAGSGACLFEAIVGVRAPFAPRERASFLGKPPATLEELAGRSVDPAAAVDAIVEAYAGLAGDVRELGVDATEAAERMAPAARGADPLVREEPAWSAEREEAIGIVAAGRDTQGRLRVGGELMASRDAVAALEARLAGLPRDAEPGDVGRAVDETLASGGAVVFGVRALASLRDVIMEARAKDG